MRVTANDPVRKTIDWRGIQVDIEWPKGTMRRYEDEDGETTFENEMFADYGRIRGTDSLDGEEIDVYLGPELGSDGIVFVVDQLVTKDSKDCLAEGKKPGDFDEHKFMLGFPDEESAREAYAGSMTPEHFGGIYGMTFDEFVELTMENRDG